MRRRGFNRSWRASAGVVAATALGFCGLATSSLEAQRLTAVPVAEGFDRPTWVGHAPNDPDRLFVVERSSGLIRIARDGAILPTPFLDIKHLLRARVDGGFMSMAFHPDYDTNGYFYIYFTDLQGHADVVRYEVSSDPDVADPDSGQLILQVLRNPNDDLHAGGFIGFSPTDGYLYVSTGDAGPQGDPNGHAQDPQLLLGKILRIDVDGGFPYTIPADNPFVNDPDVRDEIWAIGFRNPWRMSIDRATGDLWIGDVGFFEWEEVDYIPNGEGGGNYGWAIKEGSHCFSPRRNCDPKGVLIDPVLDYEHRYLIPPIRCAVVGGSVYRGASMPLLNGTYFFSDYCSNEVFALRYEDGRIVEFTNRSSELAPIGGPPANRVVSFGETVEGELYVVDHSGIIYLVDSAMKLQTSDLIGGRRALFAVTGATPNQFTYFFYSLSGVGRTAVPPLGIDLAIQNPNFIAVNRADASGAAAITATTPPSARGRTVWLQAAEFGNSSNVVSRVVR